MNIGKIIGDLRKKEGITQEALAQKLGVTNQAVSKWESGQSCPDIQLLPVLADHFGITVDALLGTASPTQSQLPWENDRTLRLVLYRGHTLLKSCPAQEGSLEFVLQGPATNVQSAVSVSCGDIHGNVEAGVDVNCGNIEGNAEAGANICCGDIGGGADAGANISCGNIGGNADAGVNISCGNIGGNADAGAMIQCGDVAGDVHSGVFADLTGKTGDADIFRMR